MWPIALVMCTFLVGLVWEESAIKLGDQKSRQMEINLELERIEHNVTANRNAGNGQNEVTSSQN